eukprot:6457022-Amphidinium_carterae.1
MLGLCLLNSWELSAVTADLQLHAHVVVHAPHVGPNERSVAPRDWEDEEVLALPSPHGSESYGPME